MKTICTNNLGLTRLINHVQLFRHYATLFHNISRYGKINCRHSVTDDGIKSMNLFAQEQMSINCRQNDISTPWLVHEVHVPIDGFNSALCSSQKFSRRSLITLYSRFAFIITAFYTVSLFTSKYLKNWQNN